MIFVLIFVLALAVLAPVLLVLRGDTDDRGTRDLAVELHRAQLREVDRDLAEGRILPAEHATATLEVQRRLLAAAGTADRATHAGARWPVAATLVAVPLLGLGLYAVSGSRPNLPSVAMTAEQARAAEDANLIAALRRQLDSMDPASDQAREGFVLLGNAEMQRGEPAAAAQAYRKALASRFEPSVAARAAEASTRAEGGVSDGSAALFRRALAAAPADAPWRPFVEQRLAEKRLPPR